jgi:hypothetical protein
VISLRLGKNLYMSTSDKLPVKWLRQSNCTHSVVVQTDKHFHSVVVRRN